jgi:pyruvate kinase
MTELNPQNRHERSQTKIIATLGPASRDKATLQNMFREGIDLCRINFSHGSHHEHMKTAENIRDMNHEFNSHVAILGDLQGPKIRLGMIEGGEIQSVAGDVLFLTNNPDLTNSNTISIDYIHFPADVESGDGILLDDGKIKLTVLETDKKEMVKTEVVFGGVIQSRKGVNLPDTKISIPSLTEKDKRDVQFAMEHEFDWIGLSFVRHPEDVEELRQMLDDKDSQMKIVAKIEKPEAVQFIDEIIEKVDAVMVARGDLGVEVDFDRVPVIQKRIVGKCLQAAKPVIIATQMMESMMNNFRPTRAEANDVANAVLDGADAVMLSGETAVGKYPVESIINMQRVIDATEGQGYEIPHQVTINPESHTFIADVLCNNATEVIKTAQAKAVVVHTAEGFTAFNVSRFRPNAFIFVFTSSKMLLRQCSMVWGVRTFYCDCFANMEEFINHAGSFLLKQNLVDPMDRILFLTSMPMGENENPNTMRLLELQPT